MIAFLLNLVSGLLSWLGSVLPLSPFSGLSLSLSGIADAIGWLNWVVPVGDMAVLLGVWLVAAAVWQVVHFVMSRFNAVLALFGGGGK